MNPLDAFAKHVATMPDRTYLRQPNNGVINETTWAQAYEQTLQLAQGLQKLGLNKGDRVAILGGNCAEWFISDFAICAAGLIPVPIYYTASRNVIEFVVSHCDTQAIIVGDVADADMVSAALPNDIITIGMSTSSKSWQHNLGDLISANQALQHIYQPAKEDTFSIVYTSGSTGNPKGVVLTYDNLAFIGEACMKMTTRGSDERFLSYLPLAHVAERALVEYSSIYCGATVTFNESIDTFIDDLRDAQVTSFFSVPRLWIKFQSQVLANIPEKKLNVLLRIPIVSAIIKNKIKNTLGFADCTVFASGSAPISPAILVWYHKLGIDISEGWGMSETFCLATTNLPFNKTKLGTIGRALDGFDVRISEQGEVLVKSRGLFQSYYNNPEATAESFTADGYFRTGDKADLDKDGYFTITGRVKDLFKSGKGKYIAPVPIESKLSTNTLIEQLCVMGSGLPKAMVAIVLSQEVSDRMDKQDIEQSLKNTIEEVNKQVEAHEVIGGALIVSDPWTIENGMLTPTLKIKRDILEEKYLNRFEGQKELLVWQA